MTVHRRYRRKPSSASQVVGDVAQVANRRSWREVLLLGAVLFVLFYWIIPALLHHWLGTLRQGTIKPIIDVLLGRRIHWFEWVGIALGSVCVFFALRNYIAGHRLSRTGEQAAGFWGRLLARWLD